MKFLWNLHFKDFKETGHTKWTVKFWQESEKEKKVLSRQENLNKNILFSCGFFIKSYCRWEHCRSQSSAQRSTWRFPAGMKDARTGEMEPEAALAVPCLPGITPQKVIRPWSLAEEQELHQMHPAGSKKAVGAGWDLSSIKFCQDEKIDAETRCLQGLHWQNRAVPAPPNLKVLGAWRGVLVTSTKSHLQQFLAGKNHLGF